jgi:hypothetical protein
MGRLRTSFADTAKAAADARERIGDATLSSVLVALILIGWLVVAWALENTQTDPRALQPIKATHPRCHLHAAPSLPLTVTPSAGVTMNILISGNGMREIGESAPLALKGGVLCPGSILSTVASNFVSTEGEHGQLLQRQVASWAQANASGSQVRLYVEIAPRVGVVSGAGEYSGNVEVNDRRAHGGTVDVNVHLLYPFQNFVMAFAFLCAFGGFSWAWLIHSLDQPPRAPGSGPSFARNLTLRLAVLMVAAIPVVDVQVLTNRDWQGTLTDYIKVATLAGSAAIVATPTLRALILPSRSGIRPRAQVAPADPTGI